MYLLILFNTTINYIRLFRLEFSIGTRVNLIPLSEIIDVFGSNDATHMLIGVLGNILLFVPLGFLLPLLWKRFSPLATVLTGAALSFAIETVQFFTGRAADIDDFILNTLGALLGCCIFRAFYMFFPVVSGKFKLRK
jgi:glycopeptide antibiotics resistance protein